MQYFKLNVEERIGINAQCISVRKNRHSIFGGRKNPPPTSLQGKTLLNLKCIDISILFPASELFYCFQ